ncbi:substrate-binding periplasmic protein [sulfur-oxidizing endosymbiont of Gigantopelta aegis]|uniref:substrate-binding periplasmic protein n=1 Tax=sulfur-oxidizing endosymbiont of Gigantopelta aegis TaxID=2794934 RepID=UPI0018DE9E56|nr:transporter substrate-binding domain-containing protein [sulfur-oxidizing endosymbiont of Gigantopelta aegis]
MWFMSHRHFFYTLFLSALLCSLLFSPLYAENHSEKVFSITSGRGTPFVTDQHDGFFDRITQQMFQRIGLKASVSLLPSQRSLLNANNGIDDGNMARIKGIEKKYTNLVMVPETVINFDFVAYSKDQQIKISTWKDLAPYNIAFIRGWKLFEKNAIDYKSLVRASDSSQLFNLLKNNRIDVALYDAWWFENKAKNIYSVKPPLARFELYFYLNKKHQALVPKLTKALQAMKNDGSYQKIYEQTLKTPINESVDLNSGK